MTFYRTAGPRGTTALLGRALPTLSNGAFTASARSVSAPSFTASRQLSSAATASRFAAGFTGQQRFANGFGVRQKFTVSGEPNAPMVELEPGETATVGQSPDTGAVTIAIVPAPESDEQAA